MKFYPLVLVSLAGLSGSLLLTGCTRTDYGGTSPYQPGPVAGKTVGNAVGVSAGNVVGFGVGTVEGVAHGMAVPFDPSYHMVRYWRTETTADGRTIQVPYDVLVDQYGRPVHMPAPTGNAKPTPAVTAPVAPPPAAPTTTTNSAPQ